MICLKICFCYIVFLSPVLTQVFLPSMSNLMEGFEMGPGRSRNRMLTSEQLEARMERNRKQQTPPATNPEYLEMNPALRRQAINQELLDARMEMASENAGSKQPKQPAQQLAYQQYKNFQGFPQYQWNMAQAQGYPTQFQYQEKNSGLQVPTNLQYYQNLVPTLSTNQLHSLAQFSGYPIMMPGDQSIPSNRQYQTMSSKRQLFTSAPSKIIDAAPTKKEEPKKPQIIVNLIAPKVLSGQNNKPTNEVKTQSVETSLLKKLVNVLEIQLKTIAARSTEILNKIDAAGSSTASGASATKSAPFHSKEVQVLHQTSIGQNLSPQSDIRTIQVGVNTAPGVYESTLKTPVTQDDPKPTTRKVYWKAVRGDKPSKNKVDYVPTSTLKNVAGLLRTTTTPIIQHKNSPRNVLNQHSLKLIEGYDTKIFSAGFIPKLLNKLPATKFDPSSQLSNFSKKYRGRDKSKLVNLLRKIIREKPRKFDKVNTIALLNNKWSHKV